MVSIAESDSDRCPQQADKMMEILLNMIPKRNGLRRPCGDYCRLNAQTVQDCYIIKHVRDFSQFLNGKSIFSVIDLKKAYNNIPIAEEDRKKSIQYHAVWTLQCCTNFSTDHGSGNFWFGFRILLYRRRLHRIK